MIERSNTLYWIIKLTPYAMIVPIAAPVILYCGIKRASTITLAIAAQKYEAVKMFVCFVQVLKVNL